jgi:AcrR family transcriptional regulator
MPKRAVGTASGAAAPHGSADPLERTRERILEGAMRAIARHGLAKLGMADVCESAGVSRGTLYRYFTSREELLESLAQYENRRFRRRVSEALLDAPAGQDRIRVVLEHVTGYVREHPAIQRIVETEPAFVLRYLREHFPFLRETSGAILGPLLERTQPVRAGAATTDQLVDWLTRLMISAVLFPDPDPEAMARGLTAVYRLLLSSPGVARVARRGSARHPAWGERGDDPR